MMDPKWKSTENVPLNLPPSMIDDGSMYKINPSVAVVFTYVFSKDASDALTANPSSLNPSQAFVKALKPPNAIAVA